MEMIQRFRRQIQNIAPADPNAPWHVRYGKIMLITGVALFAIVVFVAGFFAGDSFKKNNDQETLVSPASRQALPPLRWDSTCPKTVGKCPNSYQGTPPLILISLDGFRPDYLERNYAPTLKKLAQCGTKADFLYPVFPSKTFPNHFSIVTGLNPASHGIIDNSFYDPYKRKQFKVGASDMNDPTWYQKEPIWVTAEKQGKIAASFFWPGSDVKINNYAPTYNRRYSSKLSFDTRVDQILQWLDLPESKRPNFLTLYVNQPDNAAHHHGTKSGQVNQAISNVDNMIERLLSGLQQRNLTDCVNMLIISDHGMSDTDCKKVVDVKNFIDVSKVFAVMGPFGRVRPKGKRDQAAENGIVMQLRCKSPHMRVYPKEQLPVRWHFADNARIEPIFLDMDSSWTVVSKGVKAGDEICSGGAHGYDNYYPDMRAIFIAYGPSIKSNNAIKPFINTELYELMTELIGINPNPNNGTRGSLHHVLKAPRVLLGQMKYNPPAVADVPKNDMEYNFRVYASNCSCNQTSKQTEIADQGAKRKLHLPFGVPYSAEDNNTLRLLYNEDYITGFDLKYRIPMWTAFTLSEMKNDIRVDDVCWIGDARIPMSDSAKCGDYSDSKVKDNFVLQRPLYPPSFSTVKEQASYITNSIPKSLNHSRILEKEMYVILAKWAGEEKSLNVMMGPVFDDHATGLKPSIGNIMKNHEKYGPLVVPTHIFVIATWCSDSNTLIDSCDSTKIEVHSFLLPNLPFAQNCEPAAAIIAKNAARVVDIENLSGLSFFTDLPTYDAIRLRTAMSQRTL